MDPHDWLSTFQSRMMLATKHRSAWCVAMVGCLKDKASAWLRKLPAGSINSWEDMRIKFLAEFKTAHRPRKTVTDLFSLKQSSEESCGSYHEKFTQVYDQTRDVDDRTAMLAFQTGLASGELKTHLTLSPPVTLSLMLEQARKYSAVEPISQRGKSSTRAPQSDSAAPAGHSQSSKRKDEREFRKPQQFEPADYIPLNAKPSVILNEIKEFVPKPHGLKSDPAGRKGKGYCEFHGDHGHNTDDCWKLRNLIDNLIKEGKLSQFKQQGGDAPRGGAPHYDREIN